MRELLGNWGKSTELDSRAERVDPRAGSSLISVLVAAGASMVVLGGVATMIQFSQKAGQGVQGVSEFGTLVDSVRTLVSSPESCKSAFVDSAGNPVVLPSPTATPGTVVEAGNIVVGGSSIIEKDEKLSSITVNKIELTRLKTDPSLLALRILAQKKAGALGKQELEQSKPLYIRASFDGAGKITACSSGSDPLAPVSPGGLNLQVFQSNGTFTILARRSRRLKTGQSHVRRSWKPPLKSSPGPRQLQERGFKRTIL